MVSFHLVEVIACAGSQCCDALCSCLKKIGDSSSTRKCAVMLTRCDGKIAKVGHEGVGFPVQKMFYFHFMETHRVQCGTSTYSQRVTWPHLEVSSVYFWVKIEQVGRRGAYNAFDVRRGDVEGASARCIAIGT
jgi:hypothetical protein